MKKIFKKLIECIKITLAWLFMSVLFLMGDAFLLAQTPDLTGLLKKIIFIILIIINISYILITIYCFLSFFFKKLAKYVYDEVLGTGMISISLILPITLYYFSLTRMLLKTPFKEFTLLLPFIMIFIYVFVSVFCYYKAKKDYPDEKIISINLGHFPVFLMWVFVLLPIAAHLLFDETKRILVSYIFFHLFGLMGFILMLYICTLFIFPKVLTNKRLLNYIYIFDKSKRVLLLSDIERIKQVKSYYYECILKKGERVGLRDHSIKEKGAFVKKIMKAKEELENIDKGEEL